MPSPILLLGLYLPNVDKAVFFFHLICLSFWCHGIRNNSQYKVGEVE